MWKIPSGSASQKMRSQAGRTKKPNPSGPAAKFRGGNIGVRRNPNRKKIDRVKSFGPAHGLKNPAHEQKGAVFGRLFFFLLDGLLLAEKNYPLRVAALRREEVEVPAGTFQTIVVAPILKSPGLFEHKRNVYIWLTDDEKKIPVLMKTRIMIGSIDASLTEYRLE